MITAIKVFFQRLTSPAATKEWQTAYTELGGLGTSIGLLIAGFKAKDWSAIFQQGPEVWTGLLGIVLTLRMIFSSNVKAVANPALPQIDGK